MGIFCDVKHHIQRLTVFKKNNNNTTHVVKSQYIVKLAGHYRKINPFTVQDPPYQIMWVYCNRSEVKSMK